MIDVYSQAVITYIIGIRGSVMQDSWSKAIQYTITIVIFNFIGAIMTIILGSLIPIILAVFGCIAFYSNIEYQNYKLSRECERLERELKRQ